MEDTIKKIVVAFDISTPKGNYELKWSDMIEDSLDCYQLKLMQKEIKDFENIKQNTKYKINA